mgnify:CR=1 FL=1
MADKEIKVNFLPGSLDDFEGTQDELNDFVAEIKNLVLHGDLYENSKPVDMNTLAEDDPELYEILTDRMNKIDNTRKH